MLPLLNLSSHLHSPLQFYVHLSRSDKEHTIVHNSLLRFLHPDLTFSYGAFAILANQGDVRNVGNAPWLADLILIALSYAWLIQPSA